MMNTHLRSAQLGLVVLGLAGATRLVGASPDNGPRPAHEPAAAATPDGPIPNFVRIDAEGHTWVWGDRKDMDEARRWKRPGEPVLWFREDRQVGKEYVLRDPAFLKQLDDLARPLEEIGEAMGKLGGQQGGLGARQGNLGAQQGLLATRQGALSVREAALDMRSENDSLTPAQAAEIAQQRRDLRQQRHALDKQIAALGISQRELSSQMEALGREMRELDRKLQVAKAKAEAEIRAMLRRALASGAAKPAR
jgi:hypothetical protein